MRRRQVNPWGVSDSTLIGRILGRIRMLVRLLVPVPLQYWIFRRHLITTGKLIMEPFASLGRTRLNGDNAGQGVSIGRRSFWESGYCWGKVHVGRYCSIAENVSIGAAQHPLTWLGMSPFFYKKAGSAFQENDVETDIGNDVWIGTNAVVMKGVHVGDGAVVGAGAVVTHDVPSWAVVVGVPAHVLKYRFDERTRQRLATVKWWMTDEDFLRRLDARNVGVCLSALESRPGAAEIAGRPRVDNVLPN